MTDDVEVSETDGVFGLAAPRYLSRARLKSSPEIATLVPLLLSDEARNSSSDHRLMWHIFAGDTQARRSFLFRKQEQTGGVNNAHFLILSDTPPPEETALFDIETQEFAPSLKSGDTLRFSLLANPTVAISPSAGEPHGRSRVVDVVMAAIHSIAKDSRAEARRRAIFTAGTQWLTAQGDRNGFELVDTAETLGIDGYHKHRLPRGTKAGGKTMEYSTLEFEGLLRVTDPRAFLTKLCRGFGRAKAFGCGLMLIRRA